MVTTISSIKNFGHASFFCDCEKICDDCLSPRTQNFVDCRPKVIRAIVSILCHLCNIALSYCTLYNVQSRDHIISFYVTLATIVIRKEMLEDSLGQNRVVGLLEFDNQSILHTTSNPLFSILRIFHFLLTSIHQTLGTGIGTLDLVTLCISKLIVFILILSSSLLAQGC